MKIRSQPISVFFFISSDVRAPCMVNISANYHSQSSISIINLKINILNCQSQGICQICFTYQGRRPRPTESELLYGNLNPLSSSKPSILTATKMTSAKIKQHQNLRQPPSWEPSTWWAPTNGQLDLLLTANSWYKWSSFCWQLGGYTWRWWRKHGDDEETNLSTTSLPCRAPIIVGEGQLLSLDIVSSSTNPVISNKQ